MGNCRFCGTPIEEWEHVCDTCAQKHDLEEQQEFENEMQEKYGE